ncbi:hypothetical protein AB0I00_17915 [Streptomyces sp. NPDC050803]|uniref:hypothetical protein n=1 Tax=unclassified Streptomyces TaxID=2593676 RepID=UPI00343FA21F
MEVPEVPEVAAPEPVRPPRRRGRTALLLTGAAVLGLVAGTCVGYVVQADREPTKLPSLSQPALKQAEGEGPEPLPASRDRRVATDGDLRKLLLKKPAGAGEVDWLPGYGGDDGWVDLADYARTYEDAGDAFGLLVRDGFRRSASTGWKTDGYTVEIRLTQYRQERNLGAASRAKNSQFWATHDSDERGMTVSEEGVDSWGIPGTGNGQAYVHTRPEVEPGYEPRYFAEAYAWRDDIVLEIWVSGAEPVAKKTILGLAERQMERL